MLSSDYFLIALLSEACIMVEEQSAEYHRTRGVQCVHFAFLKKKVWISHNTGINKIEYGKFQF